MTKNISEKKERMSNYELLRIFAMLLVITSHFCVHSSWPIQAGAGFSLNFFLANVFSVGAIANIIFVIITGYFLVKSKINYKKIIALIMEMYFYSLIILVVIFVFTNHKITLHELKASILPFPYGNWFCVTYIVLYLFLPAINKLISVLSKREMFAVIVTMFLVFSIMPTILGEPNFSNLSIFVLGYFIGAYIRLYHEKNHIKTRKIISLLIITITVTISSIVVRYWIDANTGKGVEISHISYFLVNNRSPFVVIIALSLFSLFKRFKIKSNNVINTISRSVLGIYLIHENVFLRNYIWQEMVTIDSNTVGVFEFLLFAITKILAVFLSCLIIDQIRILLFGRIEEKISDKINKGLCRIGNEKRSDGDE